MYITPTLSLEDLYVIMGRIRTALNYVDKYGRPSQTHIGGFDVLPLAKAAVELKIELPDSLRPDPSRHTDGRSHNQFMRRSVEQLLAAVDAKLSQTFGQPVQQYEVPSPVFAPPPPSALQYPGLPAFQAQPNPSPGNQEVLAMIRQQQQELMALRAERDQLLAATKAGGKRSEPKSIEEQIGLGDRGPSKHKSVAEELGIVPPATTKPLGQMPAEELAPAEEGFTPPAPPWKDSDGGVATAIETTEAVAEQVRPVKENPTEDLLKDLKAISKGKK